MDKAYYKKVKTEMIGQLHLIGKDNPYNLSKVDEYITYLKAFKSCEKAIEENVVLENDVRGGGKSYKVNPALSQMPKLTAAMETIARSLGIRAIDIKDDDNGLDI